MNKENGAKWKKNARSGKIKEVLVIGGLAIALLLAVWNVFFTGDKVSVAGTQTPAEEKVSRLLEQIHGVGKADVAICETEDGVQSVVVVCEGANDLQVLMNVREAVASAVGTQEKNVKIYLKKGD